MVNDPYLKGNKEGNRPHYYCLEDADGLYWMIPLSSKIEKYQKLMDKKKSEGAKEPGVQNPAPKKKRRPRKKHPKRVDDKALQQDKK